MTIMESLSYRWFFYGGNVVVPVHNPFDTVVVSGAYNETKDDDNNNTLWLGPGLKILQDHVLGVNSIGIITLLQSQEQFLLDNNLHSLDSFITASMGNNNKNDNERCIVIEIQKYEFLCPGFIDLHIHAPQYSYTGTATDKPLMEWLNTYTFPAERRLFDDEKRAKQVYEHVVTTTLRNGTTTAVYFATLHLQPCKILVDTAIQFGQRAFIGKVCMDRNAPNNYCHTLRQNMQETESLIEYIHNKVGKIDNSDNNNITTTSTTTTTLPLILPLITPRFIPTCTPQLLTQLGNLAKKYNCHITSHISESHDEVAFSKELDADNGGRTDTRIFDEHNLLTDQCIMAHGVHLSNECLHTLKQRGTAIAHCPLSNFYFANGILQCRKLLEQGNLVGLGTDIAGGYNPSMLHSSRMAVIAAQALEQQNQNHNDNEKIGADIESNTSIIDYRHAFYLATLGGAKCLKLDHKVGTFAIGMEFDAIILSPSSNNIHIYDDTDTISDIFQKICVLGDDRNVKRVFVQGKETTIT